ncbi:GNAT family N-acetyltransferase [Niallia sp. HCP3S3_B10]|jgi:diamine N-acetyltransferase|uniref:GNAT family N-acetyltransferase n=1 Tax=unclassified Niallia TaxID=2837522 RepID=UPI00203EDD0B|nr:GNAT family N-acetyltransferase [Niallia sp. MER TA 168]MCM3364016.1 GNAT family N-acetyltransferase [Niallia sp. MER TA 168]
MTRNILVREITKENWEEAFKISVHENQGSFVPTVAESLAYAYLKPWDEALDPYALYSNDVIIGTFYISYTPGSEHNYWIGGFQIDKKYQGKGYGKATLLKIVDFIKIIHPACKSISLTVEKENNQAIYLYEKVGFTSQKKANMYGELVFKLDLTD